MSKKGAVLLAIHRGRSAEGIDFKCDEARMIILFGIPTGPIKYEM